MTTLQEVEALVHRHAAGRATIDDVLTAVEDYKGTRLHSRERLAAAVSAGDFKTLPTHYGRQVSACGKVTPTSVIRAPITTAVAEVTCGACKRTSAYTGACSARRAMAS